VDHKKSTAFLYPIIMNNHYEAPPEVREIEKILRQFTYANGYDMTEVFSDMLRYIIGYFTWKAEPLKPWRYKKEQNIVFWKVLCHWILIMKRQIAIQGWYDVFGDLYMSIVGSNSRTRSLGQNFTPAEVCELMTMITGNATSGNGMISDPTCGSGRTLLSAHAQHPKSYLVAEDIDRTCCMMTVCNFIIHGCHGEVICHNSLLPESYSDGWLVNEHLGRCGLPSVRQISKEESALWNFWQHRKQEQTIK
jgi:type I restriction enzyme M protein